MSQTLVRRQQMEAQLLASGRISPEQAKFFSQEQAKAMYKPQEVTQEQIQAQATAKRSEDFYKTIGYPQYGGKYEAFETPEGYRVKEVKETNEGLQVAFEPLPEEKGLAERMMEWTVVPLAERLGFKTIPVSPMGMADFVMGKPTEVHPLAGLAGLVAPAESLVYSVGRLAGLKTPRIPATVSGGVVSTVIETGMKGGALNVGVQVSPELMEALENPSYAAGTVLGDILLGWLIGKGVEKAVSPIVGRVKGSAAEWLTKSYEESAMAQELWKPSLAEKLAMRVTGAVPKEFPTAIIGLPKMAEAETLGMTNMGKFITGMEAFEWTEAPRTVGFGLTEPIIEISKGTAKEGIMAGIKQVAKESMPYVLYHAGRQISLVEPQGLLGFEKVPYRLGYAGKFGFAKEKLPSLSDLLKDTRAETTLSKLMLEPIERIIPRLEILPEFAAEALPKAAPAIFGAGAILMPHLLERGIQKPKRETKMKPLTRLALGSVAKTVLSQRQQPMQIPKQAQIQKQIQIQRMPVPQMPIPTTTFRIPALPSLPEGSSLASAIFGTKGAWYYRRHPVASGREVASHLFGGLRVPRSKGRAGKIDLASALMERRRRKR